MRFYFLTTILRFFHPTRSNQLKVEVTENILYFQIYFKKETQLFLKLGQSKDTILRGVLFRKFFTNYFS